MVTPKYALVEHERRFVVAAARCPRLDPATATTIDDLYLAGHLRLRSITAKGALPVLKLAKKYPGAAAMSRPMTNLYLDATEFALLATLPGRRLRKRRFPIDVAGTRFVVDVFADALTGLVLAEIDGDEGTVRAAAMPSWAAAEVTDDPHYDGGSLSRWTAADLVAHRKRFT